MTDPDNVFVAHMDEDDWKHDEETGGLVRMLRADDVLQAGLWKPGEVAGTTIELELGADETLIVLDGSGSLQVDGGPVLELRRGDMVSLRKGSKTTWVVDTDFREFWVYS
jgi:uncharacterized cupin superfamily protein